MRRTVDDITEIRLNIKAPCLAVSLCASMEHARLLAAAVAGAAIAVVVMNYLRLPATLSTPSSEAARRTVHRAEPVHGPEATAAPVKLPVSSLSEADVEAGEQCGLSAVWASGDVFRTWWSAATVESKHALLRSARELVHQRLREQSAGSALAALCPELSSDAALARLASDDLLLLIEARATAPEAARLSDSGFVRASWGAVPPGMLSPKRRASTYAHAPPPESPAARAAELTALAAAGEWDVVEVLTDNRGILLTAFFSDVILLAAALAAGVGGARRVAAALPVPAAAALLAAEGAMGRSPSADGFVLEAEPASAPTPADESMRAPTPSHSESDTDGESTPVPEVADNDN